MPEVLSQSEIDALLKAVSTGGVDSEAPDAAEEKGKTDWIAYDLTSQEKIVKGRMVALQGIHERFCTLFRNTLSGHLNKNFNLKVVSYDFLHFSDYMQSVLLPCSLTVVEVKNLKGTMIIGVSSKLTYALIDAYYGGNERPFSKIGGKEEFTPIENAILKKITHMAISDLKEAWRLNYPLDLEWKSLQSNPNFIGQITAGETVSVITIEVELESLSGTMFILVPVKPLEIIQQHLAVNLTTEINNEEELWKKHWLTELLNTELEVKAQVGSVEMPLKTINTLKVGQTIVLEQDALNPLKIEVEGLEKFKGLMGVCRGNQAVRLVDSTMD